MLGEQGSRQLSAFVCVHQPDGFKDLLTGDFCCHRLFILPGLGCCRGQVLGIEGNFGKKRENWTVPARLTRKSTRLFIIIKL